MYAGQGRRGGPGPAGSSRRPRHPYTQKLLAAFPNIHADRRTLDVIPGSPPDLRHPPPGCRFAPRCPFAMDGLHGGRAAGGDASPTASASPATSTRPERTAACSSVPPMSPRRPRASRVPRAGPAAADASPPASRRHDRAPRASRGSRSTSRSGAGCSTRFARRPRGVVRAVDGIDLDTRAGRGPRRWSASRVAARRRPGGSSSS